MTRGLAVLLCALLLGSAPASSQNTNTNPVPGSVWTYLGPTYGAGWTLPGSNLGVPDPGSSWLATFYPGFPNIPPSTLNVITPTGGVAVTAATRSGDNPSTYDSIAMNVLGYNTKTTANPPTGTWGIYLEGDVGPGVNTGTIGMEIDGGNRNVVANIAPYVMAPGPLTADLWLACGGAGFGSGGSPGTGGTLSCSVALGILANTKTFTKGIEFHSAALHPGYGIGGNGVAIEMADHQSIRWVDNTYDGGGFSEVGVMAEMWGDPAVGFYLAGKTLADTSATDINLARIGYAAGSNNAGLGIHAYRVATGPGGGFDWQTSAVVIGLDVDANTRPANSFLTFSGNGAIGIDTLNPLAALDVNGAVIVRAGMTVIGLPTSGSGGLYACIDGSGNVYRKAACP